MSWADTLDSVVVMAEMRASESVSACYDCPVLSDTRTARQLSWLSRCVQIYEGQLEAVSGSPYAAIDRQQPPKSGLLTSWIYYPLADIRIRTTNVNRSARRKLVNRF